MKRRCIYLEPKTRGRNGSGSVFGIGNVFFSCFPLDLRNGGAADICGAFNPGLTGLLTREVRLNVGSEGLVTSAPCSSTSMSLSSSAGLVDRGEGCGVSSPTGLVDC